MRAATDGTRPSRTSALIGGALLLLAVSIGLYFGGRSGNGSGSPRSAAHHTTAPNSASHHITPPASASPPPAPSGSADPAADWTPIPTDLSDELPAPNEAFGYGSTFGVAFAACNQDQGFFPPGEMHFFPLAEARGGFTAFVALESTTTTGAVQVCIDNEGDQTHGAYHFDPADAEDSFDAGTALSLPGPKNSDPNLIVIELGQVLPVVKKMTFTLTDGSVVTGTVGGGWAFAWWPGSATAETVTQYAADDSVLDESHPDAPSDWPPSSPVAPLPSPTYTLVLP